MYIEIRGEPITHAMEAYSSGYAIEAIQTLHGHVESIVQSFIFLSGNKYDVSEVDELVFAQNTSQEISLIQGIKVLLVQKLITKEEFEKLQEFNAIRNKIIHQMFMDKFLKVKKPVLRSDFENALEIGIDVSNSLIKRAVESKISIG